LKQFTPRRSRPSTRSKPRCSKLYTRQTKTSSLVRLLVAGSPSAQNLLSYVFGVRESNPGRFASSHIKKWLISESRNGGRSPQGFKVGDC
jgi:hypothetical protein